MTEEKKVAIKKIASAKPMRELMAAYFGELDEAAKTGSHKIAWCTSVGPAELLRSFGFLVYFPENHGALLGTSRAAADLIPAANARATSRAESALLSFGRVTASTSLNPAASSCWRILATS